MFTNVTTLILGVIGNIDYLEKIYYYSGSVSDLTIVCRTQIMRPSDSKM